MAEFSLGYEQNNLHNRGPPGGVEWYSAGQGGYDTTAGYAFSAGPSSAAAFGSFDDEPPLLEELGIDLGGIWKRTRGVLAFRMGAPEMQDLDVGGPLLFSTILGISHLLWHGKVHFGIILGWSVLAAIALWFVAKNIAGDSPDVGACDLYSCYCVLGYCLLPMVAFSIFSIFIPRGLLGVGAGTLTVIWCTALAAKLLVRRSPVLLQHRTLVAYPCFLTYTAFALLTLY